MLVSELHEVTNTYLKIGLLNYSSHNFGHCGYFNVAEAFTSVRLHRIRSVSATLSEVSILCIGTWDSVAFIHQDVHTDQCVKPIWIEISY